MVSSIIEESKKSKRGKMFVFFKNKKVIFIAVFLIPAFVFGYFFMKKTPSNETVAVQKNWTVKKDNIIVGVESDGKVVAKDGVELSFSVSGDNLEVDEVFVAEGDKIKKGDKIASVKTESLNFNLRTAWSSYQSALADYSETIEGAGEDDIKSAKDKISSAQISLDQTKISFEKTKQSIADNIYDKEQTLKDVKKKLDDNQNELTSQDVKDAYEDLIDNVKALNISLEEILADSDEIIGADNEAVNDDFEKSLGVKDVSSLSRAVGTYNSSKSSLNELDILALSTNKNSSYSDIEKASSQATKTLENFERHLYDMKLLLESSIVSTELTQNKLNTFISTISSNRTSINTKISALSLKNKAVKDAKENLDDYVDAYNDAVRNLEIAKEEAVRDEKNASANVTVKEMSLEQAKRDYEDLLAPLTDAEMASARSRLTSASISLEKARFELDKSILVSPIDGEVAELNYAKGDIIVSDNKKSMAVIINNDTLYIEVNIEEAEISKLSVGQKAYATFDALDELKLEGEISFISLTSSTNNNSIVTYLVRVIFNKGENEIREGMTAGIQFIIKEANDVLVIPVDAVRNVQGKPSVQLENGVWLAVSTGFTDGKKVEVISGVDAGAKIVY